jgi:hypothetical protein
MALDLDVIPTCNADIHELAGVFTERQGRLASGELWTCSPPAFAHLLSPGATLGCRQSHSFGRHGLLPFAAWM